MAQYSINMLAVDHANVPETDPIGQADLRVLTNNVAAFFQKKWAMPTTNGRQAMSFLFEHLKLQREDEVYIATTFDYPNVSSCVTCTVFNFCKPSRVITEHTKAIFIIHEFGVVHPRTRELVRYGKEKGIPVIEDCAHTIFSKSADGVQTGYLADWVIVTLPKVFPVHTGGFLIGNEELEMAQPDFSSAVLRDFHVALNEWKNISLFRSQRQYIAASYYQLLDKNKVTPLINSFEDIFPWFFPVRSSAPGRLIGHLRSNGIEAGLWHGSDVVVLPLHQYITQEHVAKVAAVLNSFSE